jgi:hypothetical protein
MPNVTVIPDDTAKEIRGLTPTIVSPTGMWSSVSSHPLAGYCYAITAAYYYSVNKNTREEITPMTVTFDGYHALSDTEFAFTHCFLQDDYNNVIDLTRDQFSDTNITIPYHDAETHTFDRAKLPGELKHVIYRVTETGQTTLSEW